MEARELRVPAKTVGTPKRRISAGMRYSPPATPRRPEMRPRPKPNVRASAIWRGANDITPPTRTSNRMSRRPVATRMPASRPFRIGVEGQGLTEDDIETRDEEADQ